MLRERTYGLERHESRLGRDYLCLPIGKTRVKTRAGLSMSTNWPVMTCAGTSYNRSSIWSRGFFSSYALDSLCTQLLIIYTIGLAEHLCTSRKIIPLRYLSEIVHLSRYAVVILNCHSSDKELSFRLNVIDFLYRVVVSLVISISRSNWLDDKRSPS